MLLSRVAATSQALAATRSRLAKRDLIAELLSEVTAADAAIVVSYLAGSLRQRRTGIGWKALRSLPVPAAQATLTVQDVDARFQVIVSWPGRDRRSPVPNKSPRCWPGPPHPSRTCCRD